MCGVQYKVIFTLNSRLKINTEAVLEDLHLKNLLRCPAMVGYNPYFCVTSKIRRFTSARDTFYNLQCLLHPARNIREIRDIPWFTNKEKGLRLL